MEFQQRWGKEWDQDAATAFQRDIEDFLSQMINEKHAPIMIPRVTIDPAHASVACNATGFAGLNLATTQTTTSTTLTTILNYTGRGVLRKLVVAEVTSGGAAANNVGLQITVDGNVIYPSAGVLATQSMMVVVVGSMHRISSSDIELYDDSVGLPFNSSIKIEGNTAAGTATYGWALSKKL